ncbi:NnrU family protein [Oryzifoliimicrobium ureilyticus]|uniref:NnrU family protein n=1 Tax=Oryzifoliimicrobium ureilyticus TaxID=3113724 RepID=UPI003076314A
MVVLIAGIVLFLLTHLVRVIAPAFRQKMLERLGDKGWRISYSIVSLLSLLLLIYGFGQARLQTGMLYYPPLWMSHIAILLMLPAMICLAASLLPAGNIAVKTKHPMVLSVKIWAVAHLLANGETASVLLFGAFLAWGVVLRISLKRRERAGEAVLPSFKGKQFDVYAVAVGALAWFLLLWKLHEWLIGVSPLAM